MTTSLWVRSVALGTAAGARASLGALAPALGAGGTASTRVAAALTVAELVADKLPQAGSRLAAPALGGRLLSGAVGAALLARRERRSPWAPAAVGALGAAAGSWGGAAWREHAQRRGWTWQAAVAEDAVALALVRFAARHG